LAGRSGLALAGGHFIATKPQKKRKYLVGVGEKKKKTGENLGREKGRSVVTKDVMEALQGEVKRPKNLFPGGGKKKQREGRRILRPTGEGGCHQTEEPGHQNQKERPSPRQRDWKKGKTKRPSQKKKCRPGTKKKTF